MPNQITTTGLEVSTQAELLANKTAALQTIYGPDINLESDTPDGQAVNIEIQAILDVEDLAVAVYNSFDPDKAFGVTLDARVAINGIQRQAGTFTLTNVTIIADRALNLHGLEQTSQPVYTVQDNAGNKWQLQTSQTIASPGTYVYGFQSAVAGAILTVPNTITIQVTTVLGVVSVNNPTTFISLGLNEETDAALKVRRQISTSIAAMGFLQSLLAALENINGVTAAFVYENNTDATDGDGTPSHSIWVIMNGGADAEIAQAIYQKRNAGAGMRGLVTFAITQVDGSMFIVRWDVVTPQNLFIKFTLTSLNGIDPPNIALIKSQLPIIFAPGVFEQVNVNDLATLIQEVDNNALVTLAGFSTSAGGVYTNFLSPSGKQFQFAVSSANIIVLPVVVTSTHSVVSVVADVVTTTLARPVNGTETFSALGGYGPFTWAMLVSGSGAPAVVAGTGAYTAGAAPGTDVVQVTDSQGHTAVVTVTVT